MNGTVEGEVYLVTPTESYGDKGFRKREVVLIQKNDRGYHNYIPVTIVRNACDECDVLQPGMRVRFEYILKGREWDPKNGQPMKYFLNAESTRMEITAGPPIQQAPAPAQYPQQYQAPPQQAPQQYPQQQMPTPQYQQQPQYQPQPGGEVPF